MHIKRRGMSRLLMFAAASTIAVLGLAGCAGQSGGSKAESQTLVIGSDMSSFPSLDTGAITLAGYEGQRDIGNLVYEGLTKRAVSTTGPADVGPALASSWKVGDDGLTYTFNLRQGVKFQDGTAWNADALIYNIHRYMNPKDPHYVKALGTYYTVLTYVDNVKKIDDNTVKFTLKKKFAYFLADLYNVYFASPTSLDKNGSAGQAKHPVGTGPFKFVKEVPNQSITFERNSTYWGEKAKLKNIVVELIPDASARVAALRSGRVNWIENVSPDSVSSLQDAGYKIAKNPFDWEWSWQFMMNEKPVNNLKVRQAMNFAIDRAAIANDLLHGTAVPSYQTFAQASKFYTSNDNLYKYDPTKAKQLLAEAGYPNGFTLKVAYITAGSGSMQSQPMNEALQTQLAKVGIKVKLIPVDFSTMYAKLAAGKTGWQAVNQAFSLEQPSSWNGFWMGCSGNFFNYCNKAGDKAYTKALSTVDDQQRAKLLQEVGHLATKDAAWMYVVNDSAPRAMASNVQGYVQPKSWWINFNSVYIK